MPDWPLALGWLIIETFIILYLVSTAVIFIIISCDWWSEKRKVTLHHFFSLMFIAAILFPVNLWRVGTGKDELKWLKRKFKPLSSTRRNK